MDYFHNADGTLKEGFFKCEKLSCIMKETACLARQCNAKKKGWTAPGYSQPGRHDRSCQNCAQGLAIKAKHEEQIVAKTNKTPNIPTPPPAPKTKVCPDPACQFQGKPQPVKNFNPHYRTKDGLQKYCKACMTRRLKAGFQPLKDAKLKKALTSGDELPANGLLLDFTDFPLVYKAIEKAAARELRTVPMQALWVLQNHFKDQGKEMSR